MILKPGVPKGVNSCEAICEIGIEDDGKWYAKWTCQKHPDYLVLKYYDGSKGKVKTTPGVHHWANKVDSFMGEN